MSRRTKVTRTVNGKNSFLSSEYVDFLARQKEEVVYFDYEDKLYGIFIGLMMTGGICMLGVAVCWSSLTAGTLMLILYLIMLFTGIYSLTDRGVE